MKVEYDFSKGERGKFYYPDAVFSFPVYLEPDVSDFMSQLADEKDVDIQELALVQKQLGISVAILCLTGATKCEVIDGQVLGQRMA